MEVLTFQEKQNKINIYIHILKLLKLSKNFKLETNAKFKQKYVFWTTILYNLKFYKGKTAFLETDSIYSAYSLLLDSLNIYFPLNSLAMV